MHEGEAAGVCLPGDPDRVLRVEVGPQRALLTGFQPAFGDEQVGVPPEPDGVVADAGIRAVADHLPVQLDPVPVTGRRVDERAALDREREVVDPFFEFGGLCGKRELGKRHRERFVHEGCKEGRTSRQAENPSVLF